MSRRPHVFQFSQFTNRTVQFSRYQEPRERRHIFRENTISVDRNQHMSSATPPVPVSLMQKLRNKFSSFKLAVKEKSQSVQHRIATRRDAKPAESSRFNGGVTVAPVETLAANSKGRATLEPAPSVVPPIPNFSSATNVSKALPTTDDTPTSQYTKVRSNSKSKPTSMTSSTRGSSWVVHYTSNGKCGAHRTASMPPQNRHRTASIFCTDPSLSPRSSWNKRVVTPAQATRAAAATSPPPSLSKPLIDPSGLVQSPQQSLIIDTADSDERDVRCVESSSCVPSMEAILCDPWQQRIALRMLVLEAMRHAFFTQYARECLFAPAGSFDFEAFRFNFECEWVPFVGEVDDEVKQALQESTARAIPATAAVPAHTSDDSTTSSPTRFSQDTPLPSAFSPDASSAIVVAATTIPATSSATSMTVHPLVLNALRSITRLELFQRYSADQQCIALRIQELHHQHHCALQQQQELVMKLSLASLQSVQPEISVTLPSQDDMAVDPTSSLIADDGTQSWKHAFSSASNSQSQFHLSVDESGYSDDLANPTSSESFTRMNNFPYVLVVAPQLASSEVPCEVSAVKYPSQESEVVAVARLDRQHLPLDWSLCRQDDVRTQLCNVRRTAKLKIIEGLGARQSVGRRSASTFSTNKH